MTDPDGITYFHLKKLLGCHNFLATLYSKNKLLESSIQKGFLLGINGTMEHIFSIESLLANARFSKKPIVMSFLDLKMLFVQFAISTFFYDAWIYQLLLFHIIISCYSCLCAYCMFLQVTGTLQHPTFVGEYFRVIHCLPF